MAFSKGELEEKIYVKQLEVFIAPKQERKVFKFIKSLDRLKQVLKQWHWKFDKTMLSNSFKINECNKYVHIKPTPKAYVIVCLNLDDMFIVGNSYDIIMNTKKILTKHLDIKDIVW